MGLIMTKIASLKCNSKKVASHNPPGLSGIRRPFWYLEGIHRYRISGILFIDWWITVRGNIATVKGITSMTGRVLWDTWNGNLHPREGSGGRNCLCIPLNMCGDIITVLTQKAWSGVTHSTVREKSGVKLILYPCFFMWFPWRVECYT